MDFETSELTLRAYDEQKKFRIYITIEKPSYEENSIEVKEEETIDHLKWHHKKGVVGIIGNIKDEKWVLWAGKIKKGVGNVEHCDQSFTDEVHFEQSWLTPPKSLVKDSKLRAY